MLAKQKELLETVRAAEASALDLLGRGVKISAVVQRLRDAGAELESRVRFLEKNSTTTPAPTRSRRAVKPAPDKDNAKTEQT